MCGASFQSAGTHWVNSDMMWYPSGTSVESKAVGMTPSLNGRTAGMPFLASWKACSM